MNLNLNEKVFLITGGSKGIGEAISRAIADEGGYVMIASRSEKETKALVSEFNARGLKSHYLIGDLADTLLCKNVIDETINYFGKIDGIVNNAGLNDGASLEAGPVAFRKSLNVNLHHYYDLVHYALPYLKKTKGSIVNISSKVALTGQGGNHPDRDFPHEIAVILGGDGQPAHGGHQ